MSLSLPDQNARFETFLLYDSRCGPCTSFMKVVTGLDFRKKIIPISIHGIKAESLVSGLLTTHRLQSSFHIVEVTNLGTQVFSAGDGLVRLVRYAPGGPFFYTVFMKVKPLRQFLRWAYFQSTRLRREKSCSVKEISR
jgi:predicted DCC family thiol-disulfide oxidoreductase YuxK